YNAHDIDLLVIGTDTNTDVQYALDHLRLKLAKQLDLIDESKFNFLWVVDWPLFEYDQDTKRFTAAHHPFTSPVKEDVEKLTTSPEEARANAYDIVLNGYELEGGSIRIHEKKV